MNIFSVHNGILTHTKKEVVNTGSRNFFKVQFVFDDTWKDFTNLKFVEFYQNGNCPHFKVQLDNQNIATIPTDILNYDLPIFVGVSAEDIGGSTLANTNFLAISTENGSNPNKENVFTPENSNITNIYNTDKTIKYLRVKNGVLQYSIDKKVWNNISGGGEGGGSSGGESLTAILAQKEIDHLVTSFVFEVNDDTYVSSVGFANKPENLTYIDWGDGTIEEYKNFDNAPTHNYDTIGKYVVKVYDATSFVRDDNAPNDAYFYNNGAYLKEVVFGYYVTAFNGFSFNNVEKLVLPKFIKSLSNIVIQAENITSLVIPKYVETYYANEDIAFTINASSLKTLIFETEIAPTNNEEINLIAPNLKNIFVPHNKIKDFKTTFADFEDKVDSNAYLSDLTDYVKFTDYPQGGKLGVVTPNMSKGIFHDNGVLYTVMAENDWIKAKTSRHYVITPANLDFAVKYGIVNNGITLTDEERAAALDWLGAVLKPNGIAANQVIIYNADGTTSALGVNTPGYHQPTKIARCDNNGEVHTSNPTSGSSCASKDYTDYLYNYLTFTDDEKAKWCSMIGTARHIVVVLAELLQAEDKMETFMQLSNLVASGQITLAVQYMGYTATPVVRVSDGVARWTLTMGTSLTTLSILEVYCDDVTFTYNAKDFDISSLAINQ